MHARIELINEIFFYVFFMDRTYVDYYENTYGCTH
jgi:hypothetical protein